MFFQREVAMKAALKLCAVLGVGALLAGCASQAELPPQTTQQLGDLRDQVVQGKAQIQTTCNAARDLTTRPQSQIEPQIKRLQDGIDRLEKLANGGRSQFNNSQQQTEAYFAQWKTELDGMSEDLQRAGTERRTKAMASYAELKRRVESLRQEFRPNMESLREISKYLQTDTTAAGVKAVTPRIDKVLDQENKLMQYCDAVIEQIDAMRGGK
jgi:DNA repair exonuclease SbcCD ATPase subunit